MGVKHQWELSPHTTPSGRILYHCPICGLYDCVPVKAKFERRECTAGKYADRWEVVPRADGHGCIVRVRAAGKAPHTGRTMVGDGYDIIMRREGGEAVINVAHRIVHHSPTGFEWGYYGSGPADAALNILAVFVDGKTAWRLHQRFKEEFIANVPREGGTIQAERIREWILARVSN